MTCFDRLKSKIDPPYNPPLTAPTDTREGKAANRRIEIVVVPDLSTLPGFEELNRAEGPR